VVKISKKNIRAIINKPSNRLLFLIIISFASSVYCILDYLSLPSFFESGKNICVYGYHVFELCPGDGIISSFETMIFFLVIPVICCMLMLSILKRNNGER
jgi:hypothetical protein